jgi:hypothetical protein
MMHLVVRGMRPESEVSSQMDAGGGRMPGTGGEEKAGESRGACSLTWSLSSGPSPAHSPAFPHRPFPLLLPCLPSLLFFPPGGNSFWGMSYSLELFLRDIGLQQYLDLLAAQEVTPLVLAGMTEKDLQEIGIAAVRQPAGRPSAALPSRALTCLLVHPCAHSSCIP